ncbi:DUF642 domain-containing protein [Rhodoblastus sp.]|uniref:DUF642 domain-containing protein n=1 Tax=Rhodoblastus sp. TaxID=1962975 RepID=UPI003F9C391D
MFLKCLRFTLAAAAIAAAPSLAFATNLVLDGDFNSPGSSSSFTTYFSGQSFGPWNVTGTGASTGVDLIGTYWQALTVGGGTVDLDGNAPGGISQALTLKQGDWYKLSFYLSGNPDGQPTVKTVAVAVGSAAETFTYTIGDNTHSSMNYILETVSFQADATNTLSFKSLDTASPWGPVVGGVAVSAPELSTWAMMLAGFAGLGFVGYRRNRATKVA